ncbi:hypothetical protein GO988_14655 [Hymenobacter sp. HMF4947]|uniref:DoxX family protein n=1 Tax=Hymenobacter ginkgonis TaxID=2682976 RepID=A0A7K1TGX8_9BACT|nr:hypothetical protein [Hymenobacter ginkgonis]
MTISLHYSIMNNLSKAARIFYGLAVVGLGIQQLAYGRFIPALLPAWPGRIPGIFLWASLVGAVLLAAGAAIVFNQKVGLLSLMVGVLLLSLLCFSHVPYELLADPYSDHLGSWTNAFTALALAGGALTMAGIYWEESSQLEASLARSTFASRVIVLGRLCFCTTIVSYGICHFLYTKYISPLVPTWIPYPTFWTHFTGVALFGAGSAITLGIRRRTSALLLGTMVFLWVIVLHLPRVINASLPTRPGELSSLLEAIAYAGTAFAIATAHSGKNGVTPSPISATLFARKEEMQS